MGTPKIRVLIADDNAGLREAPAYTARSAPDLEIGRGAGDEAEVVREAEATHPDVVFRVVFRIDRLEVDIHRQFATVPPLCGLLLFDAYRSEPLTGGVNAPGGSHAPIGSAWARASQPAGRGDLARIAQFTVPVASSVPHAATRNL